MTLFRNFGIMNLVIIHHKVIIHKNHLTVTVHQKLKVIYRPPGSVMVERSPPEQEVVSSIHSRVILKT